MYAILVFICVLVFYWWSTRQHRPPNAAQIGNGTWTLLHMISMTYPEHPTASQQNHALALLNSLSDLYPCKICAGHMTEYLKATPPDVTSGTAFKLWLCEFHNSVNQRLGKTLFNCEKLQERWLIS